MGNAFALGGTVATGMDSGFEPNISRGLHGSFLQTDAAINWGSAGGPFFDLEGQMAGGNRKIFPHPVARWAQDLPFPPPWPPL